MAPHPLAGLDDEQLRSLLAHYREQEKAGNLKISPTDFQDGELLVVNYTELFNESTAPEDWGWRMETARGCVLFKAPGAAPQVVVHAMPKFHGYRHCPEAQQHLETDGPLILMQKFDGSCISVTCFRGEVLIFTRGSRQSAQTQLARSLLSEATMALLDQMEGRTLAFELIHELDRKCEESRGDNRLVLLYVCEADGTIVPVSDLGPVAQALGVDCVGCEAVTGSEVMRRLEDLNSAASLDDLREGFVVEIGASKYKVKASVYQQLARSVVPRPSQGWMNKCFSQAKSFAEVQEAVEKMQDAPLDYGALARSLLGQHLARVDEEVARLREMHAPFTDPKALNQSDAVTKADKILLFGCVKLPLDERDAWFEGEACRLKVAQSLAKRTEPSPMSRPGFRVASGWLVLCGAPGKKRVEEWAEGLDCVVTLLRPSELQDRGLDLAAALPPLGVEWLHLPIAGASLPDPGDRAAVKTAATAVAELLRAGKAVAVHCSAGLHRTGITGFLALRLLGFSVPATFELLGQVRWETRAELEKLHYGKPSSAPEQPAQLVAVAEELLSEIQPCSTSL